MLSAFESKIQHVSGFGRKSLRSLCLWEDWEILESQVASLIIADIDLEREPGSQSPYETRLTGDTLDILVTCIKRARHALLFLTGVLIKVTLKDRVPYFRLCYLRTIKPNERRTETLAAPWARTVGFQTVR